MHDLFNATTGYTTRADNSGSPGAWTSPLFSSDAALSPHRKYMQTIAEQAAAHETAVIRTRDGERHELAMYLYVSSSLRWINSMRRLMMEMSVSRTSAGCNA